jgi:RNA polymerase sigma factor for flagellar operon FliA
MKKVGSFMKRAKSHSGWIMYQGGQEPESQLITAHAKLVKRIAQHLMTRLPPSVQTEDLIQAGMLGLLEAAKHYDSSKGASFETYASIRIRGSMLDEIRKNDWVPRSVHRNTRMISETVRKIENETGRDARDNEVALRLNITLEDYHQMVQDTNGIRVFGFEDVGMTEDTFTQGISELGLSPLEGVQYEDFRSNLAKGIAGLPERERLVLTLYYEEELNLREVGEMLGVSESRASQIHSQAMLRLQHRLKEWVA